MASFDNNVIVVKDRFDDVGTADEDFVYITKDMAGEIVEVSGVLGAAITGADETITVSVNGTSIGTITIANASSAEGDIDTLVPTSDSRFVSEGDYIKIASSGSSTGPAVWGWVLAIRR